MVCEACHTESVIESHGSPVYWLSGPGHYCRACALTRLEPWLEGLRSELRKASPTVGDEELANLGDTVLRTLLSAPLPGDDAARAAWIAERWKAAGREPPSS
jgi:hypothetical protein